MNFNINKSKEKRDRVVKEVIRPLMKKEGFKSKGLTWFKELEDVWLIVHMKNGRFNNEFTGFSFEFLFSITEKSELSEAIKIEQEWIRNQMCDISQSAFLPYERFLTPYMTTRGYQIDGYRNNKPTDYPIESIMTHVREDFEQYIFPELSKVHSLSDWNELKKEKGVL